MLIVGCQTCGETKILARTPTWTAPASSSHGSGEKGGLNLVATHRDRASATDLLRALDLTVDDMVCAPDGIARKPSPAMNLLLAERHELDPAEVLCVGDRPIDVMAARAAGMAASLLVRPGTSVTLPD